MQELVQRYMARPPARFNGEARSGRGKVDCDPGLSADENVVVSIRPLTFNSPVTFNVISKSATAVLEKDRADEEIEDEGNDELEEEPRGGDEPGKTQA